MYTIFLYISYSMIWLRIYDHVTVVIVYINVNNYYERLEPWSAIKNAFSPSSISL